MNVLRFLPKHLKRRASRFRPKSLPDYYAYAAQKRFGRSERADFIRRDILAEPFAENEFDMGSLISVLGYRIGPDPEEYLPD